MVEIDPSDKTKLLFRKVKDPADSPLGSAYKWFFRYATPNLFMWGPLAPAHDALLARASMAVIQGVLGGIVFLGTFRKHPSNAGLFRKWSNRIGCVLSGSILMVTSGKELSYYMDPHQNPLYVEIRTARTISQLKGEGAGSYWFGPKNFMPMTNDQYWKMLYNMEVFDIMVEQYDSSTLMGKFDVLLQKQYPNEMDSTKSIREIIHDEISLGAPHPNLTGNSPFIPYKGLSNDIELKESMILWINNNPIDMLILEEFKDLLNHEFPRMTTSTTTGKISDQKDK